MLQNATDNNLDSVEYWTKRQQTSNVRIKTLTYKGEVLDKNTHTKADKILKQAETNGKLSFKTILKDKKLKVVFKQIGKELKNKNKKYSKTNKKENKFLYWIN